MERVLVGVQENSTRSPSSTLLPSLHEYSGSMPDTSDGYSDTTASGTSAALDEAPASAEAAAADATTPGTSASKITGSANTRSTTVSKISRSFLRSSVASRSMIPTRAGRKTRSSLARSARG
jgi:hypothetical protein